MISTIYLVDCEWHDKMKAFHSREAALKSIVEQYFVDREALKPEDRWDVKEDMLCLIEHGFIESYAYITEVELYEKEDSNED